VSGTGWSVGPFLGRGDGAWQYNGERPDGGWHAHGYFSCDLLFIEGQAVVRRRVYKRRWREVATGRTIHSRPPDALPHYRVSTVLVIVLLARFLMLAVPEVDALELEDVRSERTLQRWRRRAALVALHVQQAVRHALIERCEPRPVEELFEAGLSPPGDVSAAPTPVTTLQRGLSMALQGARALDLSLATLLAEARRRWTEPTNRFPI